MKGKHQGYMITFKNQKKTKKQIQEIRMKNKKKRKTLSLG